MNSWKPIFSFCLFWPWIADFYKSFIIYFSVKLVVLKLLDFEENVRKIDSQLFQKTLNFFKNTLNFLKISVKFFKKSLTFLKKTSWKNPNFKFKFWFEMNPYVIWFKITSSRIADVMKFFYSPISKYKFINHSKI